MLLEAINNKFSTVALLFNRTTAVTRVNIRRADTPGRLEYIRQTAFLGDLDGPPSTAMMANLKSEIDSYYERVSDMEGDFPFSWRF